MRNERQIRSIKILDMIIMFVAITTFNVFMEKYQILCVYSSNFIS